MRLIEQNQINDNARRVKQQIQILVEKGHRIELHLHPHWLDAVYVDGQWKFPTYQNYRLQSLSKSEITDLFVTGTQILNEIAEEVHPGYKVTAFRAGGYCIQPFEVLKDGFRKSGIEIDSSVAAGLILNSPTHSCDFSKVPQSVPYRFSDDPAIASNVGEFLELPISTYSKTIINKIYERALLRINPKSYKIFGDGIGLSSRHLSVFEKIKTSLQMFSLEHIHEWYLRQKIENFDKDIITFISHPKSLSQSSFKCISMLYKTNCNFRVIDKKLWGMDD